MTSTELAPIQTHSSIQQTAANLSAAHQIATALAGTSFVPQHFRGKPDDCAAAILYGATVGMDAMTSLQNLYVIGGKPALYSRPMVGIVLSHGHEIWTETDTPERVVVCGRRKGSEVIERSEWTIDRARQAGYLSNKKYSTDPQAMLYARASGDVARKVAPDALLGLAYNVEELELSDTDEQPSGPRRVDSEQVQSAQIAPPPAGVSRIPADLAEKIAVAEDVDWLRKSDAWIERNADGEDPEVVADLRALIAGRLEVLTVEASADQAVDDGQGVIDAELAEPPS